MMPLILLAALTCDPDAARAKNDEMAALATTLAQEDQSIQMYRRDIEVSQQMIEDEKHNPTGVVDLRKLHDLGQDILNDRRVLAPLVKDYSANMARAKKLQAAIDAIIAKCAADRKLAASR